MLISSFLALLSFSKLAFVEFFLLSKDVFLKLFSFFLSNYDSHGTLHLALGLVGMHCFCFYIGSDKVFILVIQRTPNEFQFVSYNYCVFIAYISICKWRQVIWSDFDCFLFLHRLKRIFVLFVIGRYSFKRSLCLTVQKAIYPLFVHECII